MRFLIWLLIGYCAYLLFRSRSRAVAGPQAGQTQAESETHRDPVCGVYVAREDAVVGRVEDKRIYFCSIDCLERFRESVTAKDAVQAENQTLNIQREE